MKIERLKIYAVVFVVAFLCVFSFKRGLPEEWYGWMGEAVQSRFLMCGDRALSTGSGSWVVHSQVGRISVLLGMASYEEKGIRKQLTYEDIQRQEGEDESTEYLLTPLPSEDRESAGKEQDNPVSPGNNLSEEKNEQDTIQDIPFVPHELRVSLKKEDYSDYEELIKHFYTIDSNTMANEELLDVEKLLEADLSVEKVDGPQILIYHTHSREGFADSIPGDESTSIVGVGEQLKNILQEQYGYQVLHCTQAFDEQDRDNAYGRALPALEKLLEENPSIQVVIDLHRDEMPEEKKLVMNLDGRETARFMFFNGLSRTKKLGKIAYLENENLDSNLAFSFQMQYACEKYYPGLTRKIYLKGYRYNMHLCPKTLLVELGAQNNTLEEALNACDPMAHVLDMVLTDGYNKE